MARGDIEISIDAKASGAIKGFKEVESAADRARRAVSAGAKLAAAGFAVAGAAVVQIGRKYGELEQNLGGAEAVFGKHAEKVKKAGEEAFAGLGLAQSDYLAAANKMGSLFQGSGLSQQKALGLTTKAMQRAADVASVMGIDSKTAMESITRAAKNQFGMMDNLGVAMNATSIEAYALEKGMNFKWSTATEAEKSQVAMKMFFDRTKQYAGNFERESSETISGSIGKVGAAWDNLVAGMGNPDADFSKLTKDLTGAIGDVVNNVKPLVANIFGNLPAQGKIAVGVIAGLGAAFIAASAALKAYTVVSTVFNVAKGVTLALTGANTAALAGNTTALAAYNVTSKVAAAGQWALNAAMSANPIALVVIGIAALVAALVVAYKKSETFRKIVDAAFAGVKTAAGAVVSFFTQRVPAAFNKVKDGAGRALGWVKSNWPKIVAILAGPIGIAAALVIKHWDKIKGAAGALLGAVKSKIGQIANFFTRLPGRILKAVGDLSTTLVDKGWDVIRGFVKGLRDGASALVDAAIQYVVDKIPGPIKKLLGIKSPSRVMMPIGYNVGAGVAVGIESSADRVSKAVVKLTKKLKKALKGALSDKRDLVSSLSGDLASLWESVAGAFKPDIFSGSVANMAKSLGQALATNKAVKAALPGLQKTLGGSSEFFQQLLGSGNSQLILALAGNPSAAKSYKAQFDEANAYASQIGKTVADASDTKALQQQTLAEMKQIKAALKNSPGATSAPIVKAIAGSIPKGKKNTKKKL